MKLAGSDHITVSPPLLAELARTPVGPGSDSQVLWMRNTDGSQNTGTGDLELKRLCTDEAGWRMAFTRSKKGESERKLGQAINIFADMQDRLEDMVKRPL